MKLAVLGIDGGSWNVLRMLVEEGYMPSLKRLLERGVHGDLRSIVPPVTGGAWLSIATGLNPGKTGVIDFFKHVGNFVLEPVSGEDFRDRSFWDYLSVLGFRVAVLDYPLVYPAYPVNGVMLSSWGGRITAYPESVLDEIHCLVGEYNIFVDYHLEKYNNIELFLDDLRKAVEVKLRVSRSFMRRDWNLFVDVFSFTDWLQHRMWHYIDPKHPMYPGGEEASRYRRRLAEYWQMLDEYIGEVSETYDNVLIVSDHGFGPNWGVFNLVKWLAKHKFIKLKGGCMLVVAKLVKHAIRAFLRIRLFKLVPRGLRKKARKQVLSVTGLHLITVLEASLVVPLNYTIPFGALHVNPKFRDNAKKILNDVVEALMKLGEELDKELKVTVWRRDELYWGDKVDLLPDIIFTINDWACVVIKDLEKNEIYVEAPYSPRHIGSHRLDGIFVAWGKDFKKGIRVDKLSILDIAPTILYMFGAPIPDNLDGEVLKELFVYGASREPKYVPPVYYRVRKIRKRLASGKD